MKQQQFGYQSLMIKSYVCPQPGVWNELWQKLKIFSKNRACTPPEPPKPLVLGYWYGSTDQQKRDRWDETVRWAEANECISLLRLELEKFYFVLEELNTNHLRKAIEKHQTSFWGRRIESHQVFSDEEIKNLAVSLIVKDIEYKALKHTIPQPERDQFVAMLQKEFEKIFSNKRHSSPEAICISKWIENPEIEQCEIIYFRWKLNILE